MKSRIRSRWHRPNEKPLENSGSTAPAAPMGEIDTQNLSTLTDDLSNAKPSPNTREHSRGRNDQGGRRDDRPKSRNPRSRGRNDRNDRNDRNNRNNPRKNRDGHKEKDGDAKGSSSQGDRRHKKRRHNQEKQPDAHSKKPHHKNSSSRPKQENSPKKQSGLKGFLGKIFG